MVYNFESHDTLQKALHSDYRITKIASMLLQSKFRITNFAFLKNCISIIGLQVMPNLCFLVLPVNVNI
jgi:hypothetical protein